jgi:hypothetical protein
VILPKAFHTREPKTYAVTLIDGFAGNDTPQPITLRNYERFRITCESQLNKTPFLTISNKVNANLSLFGSNQYGEIKKLLDTGDYDRAFLSVVEIPDIVKRYRLALEYCMSLANEDKVIYRAIA